MITLSGFRCISIKLLKTEPGKHVKRLSIKLLKTEPGKHDSVGDQADSRDPDVDQDTPEAVLNGARILQPKNEYVSGQDGSVEQKEDLPLDRILQNCLNETEAGRLRSEEVSRDFEEVNHGDADDGCPANGGHQEVHQVLFHVEAEAIVPNDSVRQNDVEDVHQEGGYNEAYFGGSVFKKPGKKVLGFVAPFHCDG